MNLNSWPKLKPRIEFAKFIYYTKQNKSLWRGGFADVSGFRKKTVSYSAITNSKFIDAKFTQDYDDNFLIPEKQLAYKYQLSIDGHTAPWERPVWQLYSNCVVIKQKSDLIQWYYNAIEKDKHYIEFDFSKIDELEDFLKSYDEEKLNKIIDNANYFIKNNLNIEDMIAYIILVLQKYEKMQIEQ